MFELVWWQQLMLAVVFVADLAVFVDLAHDEVRAWRVGNRRKAPPPAAGHPAR